MASAKKPLGPHILTANTLLSGRTVYWTEHGWSVSREDALRAVNEDEVAELEARGSVEELMNTVVGAYLVALDDATHTPVLMRERRRAAGPSISLSSALS